MRWLLLLWLGIDEDGGQGKDECDQRSAELHDDDDDDDDDDGGRGNEGKKDSEIQKFKSKSIQVDDDESSWMTGKYSGG